MPVAAGPLHRLADTAPELREPWGYPAALGAMLTLGVVLYVSFRRRNWL